ncbi:hypothetical protein [Christiangramia sp.]|uniref:hypothetical protein n=1 Tax=Christiangramia sp. TaxID=1931228 RepID=UPI0026048387|nr:hypothetical protein [Christiangramia sp.]
MIPTKNILILSLAFIFFTIIGTISHETGHIVVAESLGYNTSLHYGSMNYDNSELNNKLDSIYSKNKYQIENNLPFEQRNNFEEGKERLESDSIKITLGGPLQTTITGLLGLVLLLKRKKRIKNRGLKIIDWLGIFLALFWLREIFNLIHSLGFEIIYNQGNYFGGDERYISEYFNLGSGAIPVILAITGIVISMYVVFRIIPEKFRLPFIISGFVGGFTGFIIWFHILGPHLIP